MPDHSVSAMQDTMIANKSQRAFGYLIDCLPIFVLSFVSLIPFIGVIIAGLIGVAYWLLRDISGASLGKLAMGIRVASKSGGPASVGARIARNITIAIPSMVVAIPLIGYFAGPACGVVMIFLEIFMLLGAGERIGDKIAGTMVVKKNPG